MGKIRIGRSARSKIGKALGVEVTSDVIEYDFDVGLGGSAKAAREEIRKAIRNVRTKAKPETIKRRQRRSNDRERYPAGQPGAKSSGRLLNDSGYLADELVVAELGKDWVVAAPVGRLSAPRTGRGKRLGKLIRRIRNKANKELDLKLAAKLAPAATKDELKRMVKVIRKTRRKRTGSRNRF